MSGVNNNTTDWCSVALRNQPVISAKVCGKGSCGCANMASANASVSGTLAVNKQLVVAGDVDVQGGLKGGGETVLKGGVSAHNPNLWNTHFPWAKDGRNYIRGDTEIRGNTVNVGDLTVQQAMTLKGGASVHNPNLWNTHFPWAADGRNYIRGDTEIRGNVNNVGDVNMGGKVFFKDAGFSTAPNAANNSDPYYLEKVIAAPNSSSLRLTMKDDKDESFEIWANSCAAGPGGCAGPGTRQHRFDAVGNVWHGGNAVIGRHVDASQTWGDGSRTLFAGWNGDKVVLGNNANKGHDYALKSAPKNTVVSTNNLMVNGTISNNRNIATGGCVMSDKVLCVGQTCIDEPTLKKVLQQLKLPALTRQQKC